MCIRDRSTLGGHGRHAARRLAEVLARVVPLIVSACRDLLRWCHTRPFAGFSCVLSHVSLLVRWMNQIGPFGALFISALRGDAAFGVIVAAGKALGGYQSCLLYT